ncbi:response regulator transcription factor [Neobacillus drentensis]|uniref:response regulator transcription factor n=1 Tax=Neobacillus drentensis TaxID=220684 RepID=UPI001F2DB970|nr:response regulator transcription factor [Neobacillus drentensis]ULT57626.1 response regulator transcription factor [Neobacillus drentensis]
MHNVLIVDDEPMIREGLQLIIPWEEYGFYIFDTASSGTEALEKYNQYQENIDLMIVDIQMPGINGLRLIEEIRKTNQHLHFIILSGFADFSYAKKAMSWGVEDYILKPINENELVTSLEKIKKALNEEKQKQLLLEKTFLARKEQLFSFLLTKNEAVDDDTFLSEATSLGLVWDSYQLILLQELQQNNLSKQETDLEEFLKNYFEDDNRGISIIYTSTIYILLNKQITKNKNLKFLYIELMELLKPYGDFCFIAGSEVNQLPEIKKSLDAAQELLKRKFFYTENTPISPDTDINPKLTSVPNVHTKNENELIDKLVYGLKIGNKEVVLKMVEQDFLAFMENRETEIAIKKRYIHLVSSAVTKLISADSTLSWLEGEYPNLVEQIYHSTSFNQLEAGIINFFSMILKEMKMDTKEVQIEKLFAFIHENYHKNIKLELLAEIFNYSSPYLGKLIKNTTGESFNTYLDHVRIQKAKELLKKNTKVYKVAELVGYTNVDYFFSKFKKYVGVSPSAFKKEKEKGLA